MKMAMKQTQTKLFDFSDVGLDFCSGSKNLFPDRFKKMLALGYNEQTVSSVAVAGNQVTFTYGGTHSYVADRVLKVNAPELLSINGGEFVIDSVTENTITMTIDGAPVSIAGNFTTKVASLGWELVYEQGVVHIYKFKSFDETDLFLRLCFQNTLNHRNVLSPCVGKTADLEAGVITDEHSLTANASLTTPIRGLLWDFSQYANESHSNYNYNQGYAEYGRAMVVGSKYHIALNLFVGNASHLSRIYGVFPTASFNYSALKLPLLLGMQSPVNINATGYNGGQDGYLPGVGLSQAYIGKIPLCFQAIKSAESSKYLFYAKPPTNESFLSANIESFNTTTAWHLELYERSTSQFLGYAYGIFTCGFADTNKPASNNKTLPMLTTDADLELPLVLHAFGGNGTDSVYFALPLEEIKIV